MFHRNRRWRVIRVESPEALADTLTSTTWCGCDGFELSGYAFLNDSISPDGLQEYAVVKKVTGRRFLQVESITVSWCRRRELRDLIELALRGGFDREHFAHEVGAIVQSTAEHGTCPLCA